MKINLNTVQQFSSQNGIKVTQSHSENKQNNTEAISININSKTLDTLNLLSSLGEETILKAYDNSYINKDGEAITKRLNEHYKKTNEENKSFPDPSKHIWNKYHNPDYPYYAKQMDRVERDTAYNQEISYLKRGYVQKPAHTDFILKDMKVVNGIVEEAEKKAYYREAVNSQFQQLLDKYSISIPKDKNLTLTIDPYDYKVTVSGLDDKNLSSLIEDTLNTADNSKELFKHIYTSTTDNNTQISQEKSDKKSLFHEIKDKTGFDLRDLENIDGKFLTKDGIDIIELYKQGVIETKTIPEEYKGMVFESYSANLSELAKKGFENVPDLVLSIDYKNGSFYDIGQSENFGTGKIKWIDELKASKSQTFGEAFKDYRIDVDIENKSDIIKEALNIKNTNFNAFSLEGKSLFEKYGDNPELMKLILMQKYLFGQDDNEIDKKFYELLKEWEESKNKE